MIGQGPNPYYSTTEDETSLYSFHTPSFLSFLRIIRKVFFNISLACDLFTGFAFAVRKTYPAYRKRNM
jgi:hypothetical protein